MKRVSRKSLKGRKARKTKKTRRARRARRNKQCGGQVPKGYPGVPVSYLPREPGELSVDKVPHVGTVEEAAADAEAAQ